MMTDDADTLRELQIGRWRYDPNTQTLTFDAVGREILDLDAGALSVDEWAERYPHAGGREMICRRNGDCLEEFTVRSAAGEKHLCFTVTGGEDSGSCWGTVQDVTRFVRIGSGDAAPHSVLTRSELMQRGQALFAQGKTYAVLAMDVGLFRNSSGHRNRGEYIEWVVRRLRLCTRRNDLIAQLGEQEFVLVLMGAGAEAARRIAQRVNGEERIHPVGGGTGAFHIGYTVVNRDDLSFADTLSRADQALYMARNGASGEPALY
jgi:diguanylate cyclase (GGDEF)-like protein